MKYLSICSGIEACTVAWDPLGWEAQGFSEIEDFRAEVLKYHYPEVKNYGDFTKIKKEDIGENTDVLVGGTPCATFSIAGLRKGLDEDRGNLALEFIKLVERINPTWVIWENVFGVLSSNKGEDFATFLGALAELGYGFAYRVLDTQYVRTQRFPRAIPQRRRRLFVVGHIRDWRYPAEVLFDSEEVSKDFRPSRRKKKTTSQELGKSTEKESLEPYIIRQSHTKSNGKPYKNDGSSFTLTASDKYAVTIFETNTPDKTARLQKEEISPTLTAMTGGNRQPCVLITASNLMPKEIHKDVKTELRAITNIEAERLQGFPDNYTQIPYRGKPKEECPSSRRYEAVGRSMSINVMEWLGTRIEKVHKKYEKI